MMFARFFTLLILANCVVGRFDSYDRQWSPDDARQNCTLRCEDECIYCKDHPPNVCSDDEKKCGEEPPEDYPDCPPDEICVPDDCLCKFFYQNLPRDIWSI